MRKIFIVIKLVSIMLTVLFVHAISTQATPIIYTVDMDSGYLVQVDRNSGAIADVGALDGGSGSALTGTFDLATLNGKLYGLHTDPWNQVDLHEINPLTGASLSSIQLFNPNTNNAILHAEGLVGLDGGLKIAYSVGGDGNYDSYTLADLALDGTISGGSLGTFDFDGLGSNEAGTEMYGLDVIGAGPPIQTEFTGPSFALTVPYAVNVFLNPNDIIKIGDDLLAIDHISGYLHLIDLNNANALTSLQLKLDDVERPLGRYTGLASLNPVPEPTTVALLGVGLVGLAGAEVRRRRKKRAVDKSKRV